MYFEKYLPIKSLYKFPYTKQKWNGSPKQINLQHRVSIRQELGQENNNKVNKKVNQKKKRRMTEGDDKQQHYIEIPMKKSSIQRNLKFIIKYARYKNFFMKEPELQIISSPSSRSPQKNNNFMILHPDHDQQNEFKSLHKKPNTNNKSLKNKTRPPIQQDQSLPKVLNHISLMKILDKKELRKKEHITKKLSINFNEGGMKNSILQNIKLIKQEKKAVRNYIKRSFEKNNAIDINKINVDEKSTEKRISKEDTTTIKKQKEDPLVNFEEELQKYDLTEEEYEIFGNRFPFGFQKIKLLGRGGFSLVWLGQHKKTKKLFAIKQIITKNNHQTHMKEIWFGSLFFTLGGIPKPEFAKYLGIKNLAKMYSYEINQNDTWLFYQKCGNSLGSSLYDIRSERINGEKIYKIFFKSLYKILARDIRLLKKVIVELCRALQLLAENLVVHSDLKTQNILIRYEDSEIKQVKLIDYGSSFAFSHLDHFSMATPEYMPHEILNFILCENQFEYNQELLKKVKGYTKPWVIDIWSLGCVLLELINGIPLWMSLPVLIQEKDQYTKKYGLFAVKGRGFQTIIDKQIDVITDLDRYLLECNYSGIFIDKSLIQVLKGMLNLEPEERMSPTQVIQILQRSQIE